MQEEKKDTIFCPCSLSKSLPQSTLELRTGDFGGIYIYDPEHEITWNHWASDNKLKGAGLCPMVDRPVHSILFA